MKLVDIYLTTISVEIRFLGDFELLSLKTCSLHHEKLFKQEFKDISSQVLNNFFSASDIRLRVANVVADHDDLLTQ